MCEYIDHLVNVCSEKYQVFSRVEKKEIMAMWIKQEIHDSKIYGPPGVIANCEGTKKALTGRDITEVFSMCQT